MSVAGHSEEDDEDDNVHDIPVLSEVHMEAPASERFGTAPSESRVREYELITTRFCGRIQVDVDNEDTTGDQVASLDDDGDVVVHRHKYKKIIVQIPHSMATPIPDVGLQIWSGSLLLADYLVHLQTEMDLSKETLLELGAGVGLVSIIGALYSKNIYCTDAFDNVLDNCKAAIELNDADGIRIRKLNWEAFRSVDSTNHSLHQQIVSNNSIRKSSYDWNEEEVQSIIDDGNVNILLAADVVYVDEWTKAFAECIYKLLRGFRKRTLYLSIEKRINFSLDQLSEVAPAYECFLDEIVRNSRFLAKEITISFPQVFTNYNRSKYLQLWEIKAAP